SFYRNEGRDCGTSCAGAFAKFVERTKYAAKSDRYSLAVEYKARAKVTPHPGDQLVTPRRIAFIAGYSRLFAALVSGKEGRLDFTYTYDGMKTKGAYGIGGNSIGRSNILLVSPVVPLRTSADTPRDGSTFATTFT